MKTESIFKVTFQNPWNHALGLDKFVKARDKEHAARIGANMGYGLVSRVEFACEDVIEDVVLSMREMSEIANISDLHI